jgi:TonB family protein
MLRNQIIKYTQLPFKSLVSHILTIVSLIAIISNTQAQTEDSNTQEGPVHILVDQMPEFPGGVQQMYDFIGEFFVFPDEALSNGVEGTIYLNFIVEKDGSLSGIEVLRGIGKGCDEEAVRVLETMPAWTPGMHKNQIVRVAYRMPLFLEIEASKNTDDEIYTIVEQLPEFPGGPNAMLKYIASQIKYPQKARDNRIQGRVFVHFIIETDGSISNITVRRGIGHGCDEEAMRIVESMPRWNPGIQNDKPVRVSFNLPIRFSLDI